MKSSSPVTELTSRLQRGKNRGIVPPHYVSYRHKSHGRRQLMAAVKKPHRGQFQPGNPGGGRPLGSRNRLTEVALAALGDDFNENGPAVIAQVRREKPHV
jgi:hypothetical protein